MDWDGLFAEALFLLGKIDPRACIRCYSPSGEGDPQTKLAREFGGTEKTIRRWINGDKRWAGRLQ
jgi:hypothetical protein